MTLRNLFSYPQTRGLDLDDPLTTCYRQDILSKHRLLRRVYLDWYARMIAALPQGNDPILEIGTGAGFLNTLVDNMITSEVVWLPLVNLAANAMQLPFAQASLCALVMTNTLHHIPDSPQFFIEALRCLRPGGRVVMVEPWISTWSNFIYRNFHHEPIDTQVSQWEFTSKGPLSGANEALPWILFKRDRQEFERRFPQFTIRCVEPFMAISYLASGGFSLRLPIPGWTTFFWFGLDRFLTHWADHTGMFALIVLEKRI